MYGWMQTITHLCSLWSNNGLLKYILCYLSIISRKHLNINTGLLSLALSMIVINTNVIMMRKGEYGYVNNECEKKGVRVSLNKGGNGVGKLWEIIIIII